MKNYYSDFLNKLNSNTLKNEEELKNAFFMLFNKITGNEIVVQERKTTTGRVDAIYGASILEFKTPKNLSNIKNYDKAKKQILKYKTDKYNQLFIFDGFKIIDVLRNQEYITNELSLSLFIELINNGSGEDSYSIENIEKKISPYFNKPLLKKIYTEALTKYSDPNLDEWKDLFAIAASTGGDSYLSTLKNKEIQDIFSEEVNFNIALFTLHTYFSIIVKNILVKNLFEQEILSMGMKPSTNKDLEEGLFWRDNSIYNMFESDIFSWYTRVDGELGKEIMVFRDQNLGGFEPLSFVFLNEDFFNIVYEIVIPHSIRKSLGEYYTPPKTAKDMLNFGDVDFSKRIMDPTCGSGTFLIQVIDQKINILSLEEGTVNIEDILSSIVGIDINPVALLAAKANILLRLIKLRKNNQPIFLPVYSGDSTKKNDAIYKKMWENKKIKKQFGSHNQLSCFAAQFLLYDNDKEGQSSLMEMLLSESNDAFNVMAKLVQVIRRSHNGNQIKFERNQEVYINLIGEVDYLVGNPPWVKWSNLPEGFRLILKDRGFGSLFSKYKNSGGNSLDLYAPIINAASDNYLKDNGEIAMIMPMSLNYNSSLETVRNFEFLNGQKISKIKDFSSRCNVFKDVSINFGFYVINKSKNLEYIKVDIEDGTEIEVSKYPHRNPFTMTLIPFESEKQFNKIRPLLGIRSKKYKVRSGVQFSPNKLRQFYIESEQDGVASLISSKIMKTQKAGIENIKFQAEVESLAEIIRTKDLRGESRKHYSWWTYKPGEKQPMTLKEIEETFPVLRQSLSIIAPLLNKSESSKFNDRISKAPWWGNIRVGVYTQAPYRICFPDNGKFTPKLVTDQKLIPEGHVRFIPLYDKKDAERIFNILNKPEVKELMRLQYLNLNKSFLPQYMYIKF